MEVWEVIQTDYYQRTSANRHTCKTGKSA